MLFEQRVDHIVEYSDIEVSVDENQTKLLSKK